MWRKVRSTQHLLSQNSRLLGRKIQSVPPGGKRNQRNPLNILPFPSLKGLSRKHPTASKKATSPLENQADLRARNRGQPRFCPGESLRCQRSERKSPESPLWKRPRASCPSGRSRFPWALRRDSPSRCPGLQARPAFRPSAGGGPLPNGGASKSWCGRPRLLPSPLPP